MNGKKEKISIILAGLCIGVISIALVLLGNPANMGFCIACFLSDFIRRRQYNTYGQKSQGWCWAASLCHSLPGSFPPGAEAAPCSALFWASSL